jgi:phosphoglycolate phosphatase-like HAD superfamily hydrolase
MTPTDGLSSWNDSPAKQAILSFVQRVTSQRSTDYVPPNERIASFDNDGTLWVEQPMYAQLAFAIDRVKHVGPTHPDWLHRQPFQGILDGDLRHVAATGEQGALELLAATHTGMTSDEFTTLVTRWLLVARHPTLDRPYTALVYQPMLELLAYLRANSFATYIVSSGGVEFIRPWAATV